MLVKTVTTVVATDSVGNPVDAIPVRNAVTGETDAAGRPVTPIPVTEDPLGVPVRVVVGKAAQNSAGQWVDTLPISGGGGGETTNALAGNRMQMPTELFTAANNVGCYRKHTASKEGGITDLEFVDVGWYIGPAFNRAIGSATFTFVKLVEYPAGVYTPVLYSGVPTYTVTANGLKKSDKLAINIPEGEDWWEHTINVFGASRDIPCIRLPAFSSTLGLTDGKYVYSGSGDPVRGAADASTDHFGSAFIKATVAKDGASSFVVWADSIGFGQGDITSVGPDGDSGYIGRGLGPRYPYFKFAKGGMTAAQMAAFAGDASFQALMAELPCTDAINEFGGGDLRDGTNVATILSAYQVIYGITPAALIGQTTILPRTDGTYTTVAGQTPKTDGNWGEELTLVEAVRAGLPNVDYVIDGSLWASSSLNSRAWKAPPQRVGDGVHPNSFAAAEGGEIVYRHKLGGSAIQPSAVLGLAVSRAGSTALPFSFSKPEFGTDPLTFTVEYKRTVDPSWATFVTGSTALSGVITGLAASTSYDIRVTADNDGPPGPSTSITVSTVATSQPIDLGTRLVSAFDAGDTAKTLADGSNILTAFNDIYGNGSLVTIGAAQTVITNGGATGNKRVIDFPASSALGGGLNQALLDALDGSTGTSKITVCEAIKYVSGATSRGFLFGRVGTSQPSFGLRQTTTNRGLSVVEVAARAALTAFQSVFDGNWHVHTVIKNGTSGVYRVDGVQVATLTLVGDGIWDFNEMFIGATPGTATVGVPAAYNPPDMYASFACVKDNLAGAELTNLEAWIGAVAGL
ncbi:fibronectin type III domain-containing protein [Rhizobium laguerreae]